MTIQEFTKLPIGTRFKIFDAVAVAVFTKVSDTYEVDPMAGQRVPNAHSLDRGMQAFRPEDPVCVLTDEEVVDAKMLEKAARVGQELADAFIFEGNKTFVEFRLVKPNYQPPYRKVVFK